MHGKRKPRSTGTLVLATVSALVVLLVFSVTYATYLFFGATGLPSVAGLHLGRNVFLGIKSLKGELYSDEARGIKNWVVFKDERNGFVIKYPNEWNRRESRSGADLKMFAQERPGLESLAMSVHAERVADPKGSFLGYFLEERGLEWQDEWKRGTINGREEIRTGLVKDGGRLTRSLVLWKSGEDVVYVEGVFYDEKNPRLKAVFENMLAEFEII